MKIFDIHHHLGSLTGGSLQEGDGFQSRDYNNRVRIMEANGVTMSGNSGGDWIHSGRRHQGHDAFQRYRGRV